MAQVHRSEFARFRNPRGPETLEIVSFGETERRTGPDVSPAALARLIEGEIIPRLLMAHQTDARGMQAERAQGHAIGAADVMGFAHLAVEQDLHRVVEAVDLLLERGVSTDRLFFDLLSPAAKLLGVMWEQDVCSFADVSIGLCRLQQVVYELAERTPPVETPITRRDALFALTPGDQHAFGLVLVAEYFRREGWRTVSAPDASLIELVDLVASQPFDLIGFSMADEKWLKPLPAVIAALRRASCNPHVRVMVGGGVFENRPDRVATVGADATAGDARAAVRGAAGLVDHTAPIA